MKFLTTRIPGVLILIIGAAIQSRVNAQQPDGLSYTGDTIWDAASGTMTFRSSGTFPAGKEEFFWNVPQSVKRIQIQPNVTVQGGFRVAFRTAENPLHIVGEDRKTSIISGTEEEKWTERNGVAENAKWKYGSVNVLADATVHVTNLTSKNPRGYHISGYAKKSVIHVSRCDILDTRAGERNNSDGFAGSAGSTMTGLFHQHG
jgi:hypothetical protein